MIAKNVYPEQTLSTESRLPFDLSMRATPPIQDVRLQIRRARPAPKSAQSQNAAVIARKPPPLKGADNLRAFARQIFMDLRIPVGADLP